MLQMIKPMKPSNNLEQFKKKHEECYWSVKLDGVRVLCHVTRHAWPDESGLLSTAYDISWYSGNGKLLPNFHTLNDQVIEYLAPLDFTEIVLDGEMCAKDFSKVMTQLRRLKDIDPSIFHYHIFDIANRGDVTLRTRLELLDTCVPTEQVHTLAHGYISSPAIEEIALSIIDLGDEGIVVKAPDSFYEQKRSLNWVKIKKEETYDVQVIGATEGTGKHTGRLGAFTCELDGHSFQVGTGFTDSEREEYWKDYWNKGIYPIIEISCMELTSKGIPRHPVFLRVREDK